MTTELEGKLYKNVSTCIIHEAAVMSVTTCASESGSGTWRNPTGDNWVSSVHERGEGSKLNDCVGSPVSTSFVKWVLVRPKGQDGAHEILRSQR